MKRACKCCGNITIEKDSLFEICPVCGWESDEVQEENPDYTGGANEMSLNQYKEYYFCLQKRSMKYSISEKALIEYVKPYLKAKGFKKKNKRWTKDIGDFTICFYIQVSCYSKEKYYIRPSVYINALLQTNLGYGHFMTEIEQTSPEEIMQKFEQWCEEWTNKNLIKKRLIAFMEWEERNPLEKRRANLVDYEKDPVPAEEFFMIDIPPTVSSTTQYILDNF